MTAALRQISTDDKGLLELWSPATLQDPAGVAYRYKSETDLYELAKAKTVALSIDVSPDGQLFACMCADKQVRVWKCGTGKLYKRFDESRDAAQQHQAVGGDSSLEALDFGRRLAVEKEMDNAKVCLALSPPRRPGSWRAHGVRGLRAYGA